MRNSTLLSNVHIWYIPHQYFRQAEQSKNRTAHWKPAAFTPPRSGEDPEGFQARPESLFDETQEKPFSIEFLLDKLLAHAPIS